MTRTEYVERVLSVMRHATASDQESIRAEIDAHIEDHICDLLELDYDEALAEERTMALMGDPEEVGRELDKQYTNGFWIWLESIAKILLVPMILVALLGIGILFHAVDHLEARFAPTQRSMEEARHSYGGSKKYQSVMGTHSALRWDGEGVLRVTDLCCTLDS